MLTVVQPVLKLTTIFLVDGLVAKLSSSEASQPITFHP